MKILTALFVALSMAAAVTVTSMVAIRVVRGESPETLTSDGMTMFVQDDFLGPAGAPPNAAYYNFDIGGGGWGNDEKQLYTRNPENVRLSGTGDLIIEARDEGDTYTSARLVTRGKLPSGYGLVESRIKMPQGQGVHPAFWMMGSNIATVGYPACGEIDIMELVNSGTVWHNAIHGPLTTNRSDQWKQSHDGPAPVDLAEDFHVYQVYREPGLVRIAIDGNVVGQYTNLGVPAGARWVFDEPMYLTLNIAVGGKWSGGVSPSTPFPITMLVDWIRFWQ
jgi:beta-glucanase (GH16 family)